MTTSTSATTIPWPVPYTLVHSNRAKYARLKICPKRGLQLVVPKHFNHSKIDAIMNTHQDWIKSKWSLIAPTLVNKEELSLPRQIILLALDETWEINYEFSPLRSVRIAETPDSQLLVYGDIQQHELVIKKLKAWLKQKAEQKLLPWLQQLSQQSNLEYSTACVRDAETRWGSCSLQKSISLNMKLLFLPPILVDYVLYHELCHTVHLNHSARFWKLLDSFHPEPLVSRSQLKKFEQHMPLWLMR